MTKIWIYGKENHRNLGKAVLQHKHNSNCRGQFLTKTTPTPPPPCHETVTNGQLPQFCRSSRFPK